jgi:hypothetical protein
LLSNS